MTPATAPDPRERAVKWAYQAAGRLDNIDSERLLSVLLSNDLRNPPVELLEAITHSAYYDPARVETCAAHRAARPLFMPLAAAWRDHGQVERAREILASVRTRMIDTRQSEASVKQVSAFENSLATTVLPTAVPPRRRTRSTELIVGVISVAVGLIGIAAMYRLGRWILVTEGALTYAGIAVALIALVPILRLYRDGVLRSVGGLMVPTLVVESDGSEVVCRFRARFGPGLIGDWLARQPAFREQPNSEIRLPKPTPAAYWPESERLSDLTGRLSRSTRFLFGGRLQYTIEVSPDLETVPWEALLYMGMARTNRKRAASLMFYRPQGDHDPARAESTQVGDEIALIARAGDTTWLERSWRDAVIQHVIVIDENRPTVPQPSTGKFRVIHLVGRPRRASGQRQVQITSDCYFQVEDIPAARASVIVVQGRPVESLERTDSDRSAGAALRAFAAELFAAGANVVVYLPPLPVTVSNRVGSKLAGFCLRTFRRRSERAWLKHVGDLRSTIRYSGMTDRLEEARARYTSSEVAGSDVFDAAYLANALDEMAGDVTVWIREAH